VAAFKIHLFGRFNTHRDDRELDCFPSTKAKELFCYLLLHRDRPHTRETLATVFWGECAPEQTRKYLRQTLWQLQHALHDLFEGDCLGIVRADKAAIRLDSGNDLWIDVSEFERAFQPVKGIAGEQMDAACAGALRRAVSLYEGNLLEGWYQDWCLYHRERLENAYLAMLDKLMAYCELHEEYDAGLTYGELLLLQDRARERTYCRLMRMRYFAGDRGGALREFQRCEAALREELGVTPARQTKELRERICADLLHKQILPMVPQQPVSDAPADCPEDGSSFLRGLHKLRTALKEIQQLIELDIQEVNNILDRHPWS
jgi:DNA-binding SARP family transcriptional activator